MKKYQYLSEKQINIIISNALFETLNEYDGEIDESTASKLKNLAIGAAMGLATTFGGTSCTTLADQNAPMQTLVFNVDTTRVNTEDMSKEEFIQYKLDCHKNDSYSANDGEVGYCIWQGKGCASQYSEHTWIVEVLSRDGKCTLQFILPESMFDICTAGKKPSNAYLPNSNISTDVIMHLEELEVYNNLSTSSSLQNQDTTKNVNTTTNYENDNCQYSNATKFYNNYIWDIGDVRIYDKFIDANKIEGSNKYDMTTAKYYFLCMKCIAKSGKTYQIIKLEVDKDTYSKYKIGDDITELNLLK